MSWREPKDGIRFRVCAFIVDDTYWDDGNRTTSRDHDFTTLGEAVAFRQVAIKAGWYETVSLVTQEKLRRHLDADAFRLYRWIADKKPRPGWEMVESSDLITLLGGLSKDAVGRGRTTP